jgi:hypothetical protein
MILVMPMRISRFVLLASMVLMTIPPVGGSKEVVGDGFEISVRILVEDCNGHDFGRPSIDGDIVAWTDRSSVKKGDSYSETILVKWMDIHDMVVHNIISETYTFYPCVSDGRIAYNGLNGSVYIFDTADRSKRRVVESGFYSPRLDGDIIIGRNRYDSGLVGFYLGNGTVRPFNVQSNDFDVWNGSIASLRDQNKKIELLNIDTGERRTIWAGNGYPYDLYIAGRYLAWRRSYHNENWIVLSTMEGDIINVTNPDQMGVGHLTMSEEYVVWTGNWKVENASGNLFIYDIDSGRTHEVFSNSTQEITPSMKGNRIVYYRFENDECDLMLAEVLSDPDPVPVDEDRPGIGSILGPTLVLDLALVIVCLCLALLPERSLWREWPRRRTV